MIKYFNEPPAMCSRTGYCYLVALNEYSMDFLRCYTVCVECTSSQLPNRSTAFAFFSTQLPIVDCKQNENMQIMCSRFHSMCVCTLTPGDTFFFFLGVTTLAQGLIRREAEETGFDKNYRHFPFSFFVN